MQKVIEEFLQKKRNQELERRKTELIELEIFEKEYSKDGVYSDDYPLMEWDESENKTRYYKRTEINITDEEYEKISKYITKPQGSNKIAVALQIISFILMAVGFISGIALANIDSKFIFSIALSYWSSSFICGMILLGFAEIIKLLQGILNK